MLLANLYRHDKAELRSSCFNCSCSSPLTRPPKYACVYHLHSGSSIYPIFCTQTLLQEDHPLPTQWQLAEAAALETLGASNDVGGSGASMSSSLPALLPSRLGINNGIKHLVLPSSSHIRRSTGQVGHQNRGSHGVMLDFDAAAIDYRWRLIYN